MSHDKRKPDWTLCINENRDDPALKPKWRNIGAAWESERGNLFVKIDDGESLEGTAMMFPYREKPTGGGYKRPYAPPSDRPRPFRPPETRAEAKSAAPASDYMERKRAERRPSAPLPPTAPLDAPCPDPEAPEWL